MIDTLKKRRGKEIIRGTGKERKGRGASTIGVIQQVGKKKQ